MTCEPDAGPRISVRYPRVVRPLTADMRIGDRRPYFLWDEDISIDELRAILGGADEDARERVLGKMLREARDIDVWHFVAPEEVARTARTGPPAGTPSRLLGVPHRRLARGWPPRRLEAR